jgi:hypothetical protein
VLTTGVSPNVTPSPGAHAIFDHSPSEANAPAAIAAKTPHIVILFAFIVFVFLSTLFVWIC